jgi:hypothetical protein
MLALATRAFARHVDGDGDGDDTGVFARRRRAAAAADDVTAVCMRMRLRWRVMYEPTSRRDVSSSRPPRGARFARRVDCVSIVVATG